MDTLCGIGLPELVILALLGFVLVGPERSQEVALTAGRWLSRIMRSPWWKDLTQMTGALRDLPNTLVRMAELEEAQADLKKTLQEIEQGTEINLNERVPQEPGQPLVSSPDPWNIRGASGSPAPTVAPTRPRAGQDVPAESVPPAPGEATEPPADDGGADAR